jgi:hypothetical protein
MPRLADHLMWLPLTKRQAEGNTMRNAKQQSVCEWAKVAPQRPLPYSKLGLALSSLRNQPIHGLRVPPTDTTNGWYIWCGGEMSSDPDFFDPLHVEHLSQYLPIAVEFLDLPPGYRFLVDGANFEDIWFDPSLVQGR